MNTVFADSRCNSFRHASVHDIANRTAPHIANDDTIIPMPSPSVFVCGFFVRGNLAVAALASGFSGTLLKIRREWRHSVRYASIWPPRLCNRRTLFQGPEQRSIPQSIRLRHRDKSVPRAHGVDASLLPQTQHLDGQSFEVAKNPQQIEPLPERRVKIPWSQGRKHTQHSLGQFFHPHSRIT